jgi:hypothetical protein
MPASRFSEDLPHIDVAPPCLGSITRPSWHRSVRRRATPRDPRGQHLVIKPEGSHAYPSTRAHCLRSALIFVTCVATAREQKVSRPGDYRGYSSAHYDGHELASRYVQVAAMARGCCGHLPAANAGRSPGGQVPDSLDAHTLQPPRHAGRPHGANYPARRCSS